MTCVLVKEADRWLITAAHNTDIVPVPFPVSWGGETMMDETSFIKELPWCAG